ncbi:hypothetical protein [Azorhizobium doebereinerae]|uniref:hypothetical protein n=1 Tax=Azorhizobium doebereinerae TaxID=281091 RepID=UPI0003FB8686|nr:hypothetical protein [Azorhizobium doebereinerae]
MSTSLLRTAAFTLALATGAAGLSAAASADDSVNQVNDSMVQQRQMDYLSRHGGYMLMQDQYSQAVGGRNSTMVVPAPRVYVPVTPTYVVTPEPSYGAVYAPASPY